MRWTRGSLSPLSILRPRLTCEERVVFARRACHFMRIYMHDISHLRLPADADAFVLTIIHQFPESSREDIEEKRVSRRGKCGP